MITDLGLREIREVKKEVLGKKGLVKENSVEMILKKDILIEIIGEQIDLAQEVIQIEIIIEAILGEDNYMKCF